MVDDLMEHATEGEAKHAMKGKVEHDKETHLHAD